MPTNVLSRNTWGRNGPLTALRLVVSLLLGVVPVSAESGGGVVFRAPAFGAGGGLGAGDIFESPLLLFLGLGLTGFYALIFAVFSSGVFISVPAGFSVCAFLLCCHNGGASSVTSTLAEANLSKRSTWQGYSLTAKERRIDQQKSGVKTLQD